VNSGQQIWQETGHRPSWAIDILLLEMSLFNTPNDRLIFLLKRLISQSLAGTGFEGF